MLRKKGLATKVIGLHVAKEKFNGCYHLQQCIPMHFIIVEIASMCLDFIIIHEVLRQIN